MGPMVHQSRVSSFKIQRSAERQFQMAGIAMMKTVSRQLYEFVEVLAVLGCQQNAVSYVCTRSPRYNVGDDMACTVQLVDGVDGATLVHVVSQQSTDMPQWSSVIGLHSVMHVKSQMPISDCPSDFSCDATSTLVIGGQLIGTWCRCLRLLTFNWESFPPSWQP